MAPLDEGQQAQSGLAALLAQDVASAWSTLDLTNLAKTLPNWLGTMGGLIQQYGSASAELAAQVYESERAASTATSRFTVPVAAPAGLDQISASLDWATNGLWDRPPTPAQARSSVLSTLPADATDQMVEAAVNAYEADADKAIADAQQVALTNVQGVTKKLVLDTGRQTNVTAATQDPGALGWMRVTDGHPCSFCALLASRGPVYKNAGSAGRTKNGDFEGPGQFKFHNHDECTAKPVFSEDDPLIAHADDLYEQYKAATQGHSGKGALRAWRRHWESQHSDS